MKKYTIIGYYPSIGEKFSEHIESPKHPDDILMDMETENDEVTICGIVNGHHICVDSDPYISGVWAGSPEETRVLS